MIPIDDLSDNDGLNDDNDQFVLEHRPMNFLDVTFSHCLATTSESSSGPNEKPFTKTKAFDLQQQRQRRRQQQQQAAVSFIFTELFLDYFQEN